MYNSVISYKCLFDCASQSQSRETLHKHRIPMLIIRGRSILATGYQAATRSACVCRDRSSQPLIQTFATGPMSSDYVGRPSLIRSEVSDTRKNRTRRWGTGAKQFSRGRVCLTELTQSDFGSLGNTPSREMRQFFTEGLHHTRYTMRA